MGTNKTKSRCTKIHSSDNVGDIMTCRTERRKWWEKPIKKCNLSNKYKTDKTKTTLQRLTCSLNFHRVPTSTPGIGPKWFCGTMVHTFWRPAHANPLPQSREVLPLAEAILAFFLLSFNFSPAFTISLSSFLHSGQNLQSNIKHQYN